MRGGIQKISLTYSRVRGLLRFVLTLTTLRVFGVLLGPVSYNLINSIKYKAIVFVKASKKWPRIAKALAYCTTG